MDWKKRCSKETWENSSSENKIDVNTDSFLNYTRVVQIWWVRPVSVSVVD